LDREYELFYIVRPDVDEDQVRTAMDEVAALIAGHGGEVTKSSLWGRRRLAYPIAGFNDGYYALHEITLPAEKVRELERQLRLDERVIRQLISLKQVYYLPGDEDRRGRVRARGRDRAVASDGATPEAGSPADGGREAEAAADDGFGADQVDEGEPAGVGAPEEVSADDQSGEE
jgi:small subunit ribosomal protein S6